MIYKLFIVCVDGSFINLQTENLEYVKDFLEEQDHEGSSVNLEIKYEQEEVYKFLKGQTK